MTESLSSAFSQYAPNTGPMPQSFPKDADAAAHSSLLTHEFWTRIERASATDRDASPSGSSDGLSQDIKTCQPVEMAVPHAPEALRSSEQQIDQAFRQNGDRSIQYPRLNHPVSFAERARILIAKPADSQNVQAADNAPHNQHHRKERRASLNRPIGCVYSEIQNQNRDSILLGPRSPKRSSIPQKLQPQANLETTQLHTQREDIVSPKKSTIDHENITQGFDSRAQGPRKAWALERSPLQTLEVKFSDISKEEKRARMEQAERSLKESRIRSSRGKLSVGSTKTPNLLEGAPASPKASSTESPGLSVHQIRGRAHLVVDTTQEDQGSQLDVHKQTCGFQTTPFSHTLSGLPHSPEVHENLSSLRQDRGVRFVEDDHVSARRRVPSIPTVPTIKTDIFNAVAASGQSHTHMSPSPEQSHYASKANAIPRKGSTARQTTVPRPVLKESTYSDAQAVPDLTPSQHLKTISQSQSKAGLKTKTTKLADAAGGRRHHVPDILHWRPTHATHAHDTVASQEQPLDEWRKAGIARLTAADFSDSVDPITKPQPGVQSSVLRDRGKSINERNGYLDRTGKNTLFLSASDDHKEYLAKRSGNWSMINTRSYDTDPKSPVARESSVSRIKAVLALHRMPGRRIPWTDMPSSYSYSCSDLADHSPSHLDHFCEPYLSEKLTQSMRSVRIRPVPGTTTFFPPLYLKCGPLLRYTGLSRGKLDGDDRLAYAPSEHETWRGSVMIVTTDIDSIYEPTPVLRLFPEPMELLPPPSRNFDANQTNDITSEYDDPIAGLPKISRTGRTVYVKPADDLGEAIDLSRLENDEGLFEETRTAAVPTAYGTPNFRRSRNIPQASRILSEASPRRGQEVKGFRLHAERGVTFWRFNIEVQLGIQQARIAYSINEGPAIGFWVPARGHTMNVMFHSCNGFSSSVDPDDFSGPDPLWRDVLNSHQRSPFHVMIGGGDQIYNDAVMSQSPLFREWLETRNPLYKQQADFSGHMQDELETFYLERYSMWFSQGLFGMANSQIPMVNIWDDHDIIDGFGSYPQSFMHTPVFRGLGATAYHYYMLFQHQSVRSETCADEASWLTGAVPGPYINELSRSIFLHLGKSVAFLGLDCRTERTRNEILSEATYDLVFDRCRREIIQGETQHLIVLLGVPIAYPRLVWLETLLTSRIMDPIKALGRVGMMGNLLNRFDGGVEILDDLDDHWTAKNHKLERNWLIKELQALAAEKSVRITILGGDVHLAAVGQFFSNPKLNIAKYHDHRYMANVISSAIVNTPPPEIMGDILNRRNKTHHLDQETDENMIPLFTHDVDGRTRNNRRLLPRRNWCSIRECQPGSTYDSTPSSSEPSEFSDDSFERPQSSRRRTMSLTRKNIKPRNFIRRLSGQDLLPVPSTSRDIIFSDLPSARFSEKNKRTFQEHMDHDLSPLPDKFSPPAHYISASSPPPRKSHRRPTNVAFGAAARGNTHGSSDHINLENGLDIVIHCEVNQRDPAGNTVPYRLLIPALKYEGPDDLRMSPLRTRSLLKKFNALRGSRHSARAADGDSEDDGSPRELTASDSEKEELAEQRVPRRWSFGLTQRRQYRDQTPERQRVLREVEYQKSISPPKNAPFNTRPQQPRHPEDHASSRVSSEPAHTDVRQVALGKPIQRDTDLVDYESPTSQRGSLDHHKYIDKAKDQQDLNGLSRAASKNDRVLGAGKSRPATGTRDQDSSKSQRISGYGEGAYDEEDFGELARPEPNEATIEHHDEQGFVASANQSGITDLDQKRSWRRLFA